MPKDVQLGSTNNKFKNSSDAGDSTKVNINVGGAAQNTHDAIVIGSGISGSWAAKELRTWYKTLVLERGRPVEHIKRLSYGYKKSVGIATQGTHNCRNAERKSVDQKLRLW